MTPLVSPVCINDVYRFISDNISPQFLMKVIAKLNSISLEVLVSRKNPYLYCAKGLHHPSEVATALIEAFVASGEESIFGNFSEQLAIFVAEKVHGGFKSAIEGLDLEILDQRERIRHFVTIKSGPNWANSEAKRKMYTAFEAAKKTLRTSQGNNEWKPRCVEGCCYGRSLKRKHGKNYEKLCGQEFWEYVSGSSTFYVDVLQAFGSAAENAVSEFGEAKRAATARLEAVIRRSLCTTNGLLDWKQWAQFTCGAEGNRKF